MAKTILAVIKSNVVATAYIKVDDKGKVKIEKVIEILSYDTKCYRKL